MNPLAEQLNKVIDKDNSHALEMLSDYGKRIYFPTTGILAQSAEAKKDAYLYNATIGIATENGKPMGLATVTDQFGADINHTSLAYAPSPGVPALRSKWQELQCLKNPEMQGKSSSLPVVTQALTHGISLAASLFMNAGDTLLLPDHFWGNYTLYFNHTLGVEMKNFALFDENGGFNHKAFETSLREAAKTQSKISIILNFPNNPTGYSLRKSEVENIVNVLKTVADEGTNLVVFCDDAYFGLFFEEDVLKESLFGFLADSHERIMAVKIDGATKEDYVWGLRCGFLTFSCKNGTPELYKALEQKAGGAIRATISNCSNLSQLMILNSLNSADYASEKLNKFNIMKARYDQVKETLSNPKFAEYFEPYPYNSGYFMSMKLKNGVNAEEYRQKLLKTQGIGTIAIGASNIRVAFSCLELSNIEDLFNKMYETASEF